MAWQQLQSAKAISRIGVAEKPEPLILVALRTLDEWIDCIGTKQVVIRRIARRKAQPFHAFQRTRRMSLPNQRTYHPLPVRHAQRTPAERHFDQFIQPDSVDPV